MFFFLIIADDVVECVQRIAKDFRVRSGAFGKRIQIFLGIANVFFSLTDKLQVNTSLLSCKLSKREIPVSLQYGNQVIHSLCANFHAVFLQKYMPIILHFVGQVWKNNLSLQEKNASQRQLNLLTFLILLINFLRLECLLTKRFTVRNKNALIRSLI